MTSPTCGSSIGAVTWRVIRHGWVVTGRPVARCGAAAGVGAAVEAPAGGALVDLPGAERDRLAQPVGVAAGVLRPRRRTGGRSTPRSGIRPVGAPVPRPRPAWRRPARRWRRSSSTCCRSTSCVELLELAVARAARAPARARRRASPARRRRRRCARRRRRRSAAVGRLPARAGSRRRLGRGSGGPMIARYSRAARSSASSSPSGIQISLREQLRRARRRSSLAEHALPDRREAGRGRRGRRRRSGCGPAGRRSRGRRGRASAAARRPARRAAARRSAGRITSIDRGLQRAADEPPAERVGREVAARRGPPSAAPRAAAGRPRAAARPGPRTRTSATSCSIAQRLVCLPWKVSCSATPKHAQHAPAREPRRRAIVRAGRAASSASR